MTRFPPLHLHVKGIATLHTMDAQQQLLRGKSAAITGGLTGIGRAIALGFLRHGCNVGINYLGGPSDETLLEQLKSELPQNGTQFVSVAGDISNPETGKLLVKEVVDRWGTLDVFVSNAGICQFAELLDIQPDLLSKTIRTNLDGSFYAVQAAARQMSAQSPSGGSIIGVSSISALVGGGQQCHYTPTKAGILSLMQSCAVALGKHGIRCNALLPGTIRTQLNEKDLENEDKRKYMEGRIPLGRTGVTEDMVGPAIFLASEMSQYVTGAQLLVDGGLFVNLQ
ncbi:L-rhamnose-1-dehydrogenase [Xanthoria calcicola]